MLHRIRLSILIIAALLVGACTPPKPFRHPQFTVAPNDVLAVKARNWAKQMGYSLDAELGTNVACTIGYCIVGVFFKTEDEAEVVEARLSKLQGYDGIGLDLGSDSKDSNLLFQ